MAQTSSPSFQVVQSVALGMSTLPPNAANAVVSATGETTVIDGLSRLGSPGRFVQLDALGAPI